MTRFNPIKSMLSLAALATITLLSSPVHASVSNTTSSESENSPQQQVDGSSIAQHSEDSSILNIARFVLSSKTVAALAGIGGIA